MKGRKFEMLWLDGAAEGGAKSSAEAAVEGMLIDELSARGAGAIAALTLNAAKQVWLFCR